MDLPHLMVVLGLALLAAGVTGVAISFSGVQVAAVTSSRSVGTIVLGVVLAGLGAWLITQQGFKVTGARLNWDDSVTPACVGNETYTGILRTRGRPGPISYRILTGTKVLRSATVTPLGDGTTSIEGTLHLAGTHLQTSSGISTASIRLEILSPSQMVTVPAQINLPTPCGLVFVTNP